MTSPFACFIPIWQDHLFIFSSLALIALIGIPHWRIESISDCLRSLTRLFPNWEIVITLGALELTLPLLAVTFCSLLPLSVIPLHFPIWGVSVSIALWTTITYLALIYRPLQWNNEYLNDPSLGYLWILSSGVVETISRFARAITLGARISVNLIIGAILHGVVTNILPILGLIFLTFLELIVATIQTYVLILLMCLYSEELE